MRKRVREKERVFTPLPCPTSSLPITPKYCISTTANRRICQSQRLLPVALTRSLLNVLTSSSAGMVDGDRERDGGGTVGMFHRVGRSDGLMARDLPQGWTS